MICLSTDLSGYSISGRGRNNLCTLLKPNFSLHLAAFSVRILDQIGLHADLAGTLAIIKLVLCCISKTRAQDPTSVIIFPSPHTSSFSRFTRRLFGDSVARACRQAGVGIALSMRPDRALLDWTPINNELCAVRFYGSVRRNSNRLERCC